MCLLVLLVVLWLLNGTQLPILASCRTSQYHRIFVPHSASLWNDLDDQSCSMVWDRRVLRAEPMFSCCSHQLLLFVLHCFFFTFFQWLVTLFCGGWDLRTDIVFLLSPSLALPTPFDNNNNIRSGINLFYFNTIIIINYIAWTTYQRY